MIAFVIGIGSMGLALAIGGWNGAVGWGIGYLACFFIASLEVRELKAKRDSEDR